MKKTLKIICWTFGALVALVVLFVLTVPLWLGSLARPTINAAVPRLTKTAFNVGHLSLNPYKGRFELGDLVLGNPSGYSEPVAVSVSNLVLDVDMSTVQTPVIRIEEVTVAGVYLAYLHGGAEQVDNFTQIQYNLAGGKAKYEAKKAKTEAAERAKAARESTQGIEQRGMSQALEDVAEKFIINRLTLHDIRLKYEFITLPIPTITLTNLGKDSGGITAVELSMKIWEAILKSASHAGGGLKSLGGLINTNAGKLGEAMKNTGLKDKTSKRVDAVMKLLNL